MMGEMCSSVHVDFSRMDIPDGVKIRDALTLCLQILGDGQDDTMGDSLLELITFYMCASLQLLSWANSSCCLRL